MIKLTSLVSALLFTISASLAQIDVEDKLKKQTNQKANSNVDQGINKGLNDMEDGVKSLFKKKDKNKAADKKKDENKEADKKASNDDPNGTAGSMTVYSKYDFVPGDKIIFQDNLQGEELGEFPSKWDLHSGNVEVARNEDEYLISFASTAEIMPLMESEDYLPEKFTIEFDCYFHLKGNESYTLELPGTGGITTRYNQAMMGNFKGKVKDGSEASGGAGWRHVAVAFNKRSLKVYINEDRVLNIPNLDINPTNFSISALSHGASAGNPALLRNIKVAEGGKKLYDRVMTDGKIVTTGILFASGQATILPESMGVINKIVLLMKDEPDLNFSIEGHTDNDGNDEFNQKLSEQRAAAVKEKFVELGIDDSRMTTKGWGESRSVADNSTPEGKANNRRVEFIKQ